jgi:hypothetical protein
MYGPAPQPAKTDTKNSDNTTPITPIILIAFFITIISYSDARFFKNRQKTFNVICVSLFQACEFKQRG